MKKTKRVELANQEEEDIGLSYPETVLSEPEKVYLDLGSDFPKTVELKCASDEKHLLESLRFYKLSVHGYKFNEVGEKFLCVTLLGKHS